MRYQHAVQQFCLLQSHNHLHVSLNGCRSDSIQRNPGTLLSTLTQADPASDRGVVTGGTNLTTDDTGRAKVRLTLTGQPADFLRAVPAP